MDQATANSLLNIAIQEAPAAISLLKGLFAKHNPSEPTPTDQEVIAAWTQAYTSSLAKDELWLSVHPE